MQIYGQERRLDSFSSSWTNLRMRGFLVNTQVRRVNDLSYGEVTRL